MNVLTGTKSQKKKKGNGVKKFFKKMFKNMFDDEKAKASGADGAEAGKELGMQGEEGTKE